MTPSPPFPCAFDPNHPTDALDRLSADFRAGYLSGCLAGFDLGWSAADAHADGLHRGAVDVARRVASPQAMDYRAREDRRRRAQEVAAARHRANARPWPDELGPPHPAALFVVPSPVELAADARRMDLYDEGAA